MKVASLVDGREAVDEMHLSLNTWTLFLHAAFISKQKKYMVDETAAR